MMKAIIVEDELPARIELNYFITHHSNIEISSEFDNGLDVLKFLQHHEVDVIFLDINIPALDGLTLAKTIHQFKHKPKIIFITAYKEHAISAFELEAFDYILKPFSESRIITTLERLSSYQTLVESPHSSSNQVKDTIALWYQQKLFIVNLKDIYFCEALERVVKVYTHDRTYIAKMTFSELEGKLPKSIFFRSHRSYIINITKIKEIIPWFNSTYKIKFEKVDHEAYVSRSKVKEFKQLIGA